MSEFDSYKLHSQLALPFLETNLGYLGEIFNILELKFGLKKNSSQKFIDLGSGDGRIVIHVARNYCIRSIGIEINSNLINEAIEQVNSLKKKKMLKRRVFNNIKFIEFDFFKINLKKYDFIFTYSLPSMQKYLRHLFKTAKSTAIVISHKYELNQFDSLLNLKYKLSHSEGKNNIHTYFYSISEFNQNNDFL